VSAGLPKHGPRRGGLWSCSVFALALSLVVVLMAVCSGVRAEAQAVLTADAHVAASDPTTNFGSLSNLRVGGGYSTLMQFDLSLLPAGTTAAQVTRAVLVVYANRVDVAGSVSVAPLAGTWAEGGVTYASLPAAGPVVASANVASAGSFVGVDVTATVQAWLAGTQANNGLLLTSSAAQVQLDSKENDETAHPPQLAITLASGGATGATGATGPQGPQGIQGLQGPAGPQGQQGAQGMTGAAGAAGPAGAPGVPGPAGAPGVQGPAGATGATGPQGQSGAAGLMGAPGAAGATGPTGATGATGSPGLVYQGSYASTSNYALGDVVVFAGSSYASLHASNHGNTPGLSPQDWGELTAQGPQGLQGAAGATGAAGPQGVPGSVGPPGEQGITGAQGPAGQAGAQGIPGATGDTGLQGPMGPAGVAGPVGLSWQGAYSSATNYALGDGVLWQGAGWVSIVSNNHGNTPDQSPLAWSQFVAQGAIGPAGVTGATGSTGPMGLQGVQGVAGATGATGATGPQGQGLNFTGAYSAVNAYAVGDVVSYIGSSWVSLLAGNHGQTPDQSPAYWMQLAAKGDAGAMGATGSQGMPGATGATGATGAAGTPGSAGPQGPIGMQGPAGAQGLTGQMGAAGATGAAGMQGPAGQAGAQGIQGVAGPAGATGPQGIAGPAGAVGMTWQGNYSSSTNYALHDAVAYLGASYVSLIAGNHGNAPDQSPSAWLLFSAPGATGTMGAAGMAGPQGIQGVAGPAGAAGAAGSSGAQGIQGATGPAGAQGAVGAMGLQGPAGAQGLQGATGPAGAVGAAGPQGPAGQAGAQGLQGAAGMTGAAGAQGPAGPAGVQGATGAMGPAGAVGITFRGTWQSGIGYAVDDVVTYSSQTYIALSGNSGQQPDTSTSVWSVLAAQGGAGATGPAGAAASISIDPATSTLAAGSSATVTNEGTSSNVILKFAIPQGAAGAAGSSGGGGSASTGGSSYAAIGHTVTYSGFGAVNAPTFNATETATVLAWVPKGCAATRLDVYAQQSNTITVTLRAGTPGSMSTTALSCSTSNGTCSLTLSTPVTIAPGQFVDLSIAGGSSTASSVWTAVECD
jgi:hypothetical protein